MRRKFFGSAGALPSRKPLAIRYSLPFLARQEPRPPTSFRPPSLVPRPFRFCPVSLAPCPALSWRSFMGCCTLQSGAVVA
jgi:hypothetical protein